MKTLEERAEHEVELISQDEAMTDEEKRRAIRDIYGELEELLEKFERDERDNKSQIY